MKVFSLPPELAAPEPDYSNYDRDADQAAEEAHKAQVKAALIDAGYTGPYTGEIYSEGVADGSALYMLADGKGKYGSSFLFHLPYGDGYQSRNIQYVPKKAIIDGIKREREYAKLFSSRKAAV